MLPTRARTRALAHSDAPLSPSGVTSPSPATKERLPTGDSGPGPPAGEMPVALIVAWVPKEALRQPACPPGRAAVRAVQAGKQTCPWVHSVPGEVDTGPPLRPRKCGPRSLGQCLEHALAGRSLLETRPRVAPTALLVLKILATLHPLWGSGPLVFTPCPPLSICFSEQQGSWDRGEAVVPAPGGGSA